MELNMKSHANRQLQRPLKLPTKGAGVEYGKFAERFAWDFMFNSMIVGFHAEFLFPHLNSAPVFQNTSTGPRCSRSNGSQGNTRGRLATPPRRQSAEGPFGLGLPKMDRPADDLSIRRPFRSLSCWRKVNKSTSPPQLTFVWK